MRMCPAHRLRSLNAMRAALLAEKRVLCVSTQLIEAVVHIDFASVLRGPGRAGFHRAGGGRCNRMATELAGGYTLTRSQRPSEAVGGNSERPAKRPSGVGRLEGVQGDAPFPLSDHLQTKRCFEHHFFARKDQMDYPVKAQHDCSARMAWRSLMQCGWE
jgi:CRISPR-associated endonuclease/helicase Cas3